MGTVKIPAPSAWDTVPAGLLAAGDILELTRVDDRFDDGVLDAVNIGTVQAGGGTVQERKGLRLLTTSLADGAVIYPKAGIDKTISDAYIVRSRGRDSVLYFASFLQQAPAAPVIGTAGGIGANRVSDCLDSSGLIYVYTYNAAGTIYYWNEAAGQWQTVSASTATQSSNLALIERRFIWSPTGFKWQVINAETGVTIIDTDEWLWANVKDNGVDPYWFGDGDYLSNFWTMGTVLHSLTNLYKSGLIATMGEITGGGAVIEQVPFTETGAVSYRYNLNRAGWSAAKTLAEITAELVGQVCHYLDLELTFTSDGETPASVDINGGVLAGYGAAFTLPLEAVELEDLEVVEVAG